jgi:hypothetical protein
MRQADTIFTDPDGDIRCDVPVLYQGIVKSFEVTIPLQDLLDLIPTDPEIYSPIRLLLGLECVAGMAFNVAVEQCAPDERLAPAW